MVVPATLHSQPVHSAQEEPPPGSLQECLPTLPLASGFTLLLLWAARAQLAGSLE
jgi:hypothetical protein